MTVAGEIDLFAPWREGPAALRQRHVSRERELDAIRSAALAFAGGGSPLPVYLFGATGIGKSHLLTLALEAIAELTPAADVAITVVPEDAVAIRSAARLFDMMTQGIDRQPWLQWETRRDPGPAAKRYVVLFEGLDRQLRALGTQGRRELRRLLGDGPQMWIVGAGMTLPSELAAADEAFFGAFDPWPLDALDVEDACRLLDSVTSESEHDAAWRGMRQTLATLAGGNPRTLVALGIARVAQRRAPASELLHRVVHPFTSQYRNKLRGLSPQAQQIVTHLASAPRELGPAEIASFLGTSTTQMSVQAGRLVDDGVLRRRADGRQTWYRIADPLFRYWLEYRSARWSQTRVGWVATSVEEIERIPGGDEATAAAARTAASTRFEEAVTSEGKPPREALTELIAGAAPIEDRATIARLRRVLGESGHGRSWVLRSSERLELARAPFLRALFLQQGRIWSHPPLLEPPEVLSALEHDVLDAAELLDVAVRLGHVELTRRAARALLRGARPLPRASRVRVFDVETSDLIAQLLDRRTACESPAAVRGALSWLASLARAPEERLEAVLGRLAGLRFRVDDALHEVALAALLARAPERFDAVARALPSDWADALEGARRLVAQLREAVRGHLHPELAAVNRVVEIEP